MINAKSLRIRFDKTDEFRRFYDLTRCSILFGSEKYDFIYNKIRYLIGVKSGVTYFISHNYAKIKVDSYDSLLLEKTIKIKISQFLIKIKINNYYYNIFLEKTSYELPKKLVLYKI